jgi:hypothetical protein
VIIVNVDMVAHDKWKAINVFHWSYFLGSSYSFFLFDYFALFLVYLITNMIFFSTLKKSLVWLSHQCSELQKAYLCTILCISKFAKNINLFKKLNNDHGFMFFQRTPHLLFCFASWIHDENTRFTTTTNWLLMISNNYI